MKKDKKKKIKSIEFTFDESKANKLTAISLVTSPAIEKDYKFFNKTVSSKFKVTNEERQEISGPVMVPNLEIERVDEFTGEKYYCWFSEETIRKCAQFFFKNGLNTKGNFNHNDKFSNELFVFESWIVEDPEKDKSNSLVFEPQIKGTWFATYYVKDKELFNTIKREGLRGFSVEGIWEAEAEQRFVNALYSVIEGDYSEQEMIKEINALLNKADLDEKKR